MPKYVKEGKLESREVPKFAGHLLFMGGMRKKENKLPGEQR